MLGLHWSVSFQASKTCWKNTNLEIVHQCFRLISWTVDFRNIAKLVDSISKATDQVSLFASVSFVYILSIQLLNSINSGDCTYFGSVNIEPIAKLFVS